jgi:hypothetical protein
VRFALVISLFALGAACNARDVPRTPEDTCALACAARAPRCTENECARGCNVSLDRLIEREGDNVVACIAKAGACDDPAWAKCATRVGVHADGGPPAPPPPPPED